MNKTKLFTILFIAMTFLFASFGGHGADAQQVGLSLTKSLFDVSTSAGSEISDSLIIFNQSESSLIPVHIQVSPWDLTDEDDIEFIVAEPALNAATWFNIETRSGTNSQWQAGRDFILGAGDAREIRFKINVPADTPPGSYFAMVRFQTVLPEFYFDQNGLSFEDTPQAGPRFVPELGALFFIKVGLLGLDTQSNSYAANIEGFDVGEQNRISLLEAVLPQAEAGVYDAVVNKFIAKIKNTGIYHFKTEGYIEVRNMFGNEVARASLPPKYMLPQRARGVDIDLGLEDSFLKRNLRFGPYSAMLVLVVPENDNPIVQSMRFWIVPWKFWLVLLFIVSSVVLLRKRLWAAIKALVGRV